MLQNIINAIFRKSITAAVPSETFDLYMEEYDKLENYVHLAKYFTDLQEDQEYQHLVKIDELRLEVMRYILEEENSRRSNRLLYKISQLQETYERMLHNKNMKSIHYPLQENEMIYINTTTLLL